jgi:MYXO-CTERM domain-containing protein
MDLGQFMELAANNAQPPQTGYLRAYFQVSPEGFGQTGKLTNDFTFEQNHQGYTMLDDNGPVGVDTHFYEFSYLVAGDPAPASYRVFAEDADQHYFPTPDQPGSYSLLDSDFVETQDAPGEQQRPGGVVPFDDANVSGTAVPEPAGATLLLGMAGMGALARRRRQRTSH